MPDLFREVSADTVSPAYELVVVGSGFGSLFFLHEWVRRRPGGGPILVLERGTFLSHADQIAARRNAETDHQTTYRRRRGHKPWTYTIGFGGGLNCWFGQTPRMHPSDFALHSRYGVGRDWPLSYDDLEPYYAQAEDIMAIAGESDTPRLFPRSRPYPLPPHLMSAPDLALKALYPEMHIAAPAARASLALPSRNQCCATTTCHLCPVDAKFTAENGFAALLGDRRIDVMLKADVKAVETTGGVASGVVLESPKGRLRIGADLVVLGANAVFNPLILHRSGLAHPLLGRRLNEQVGVVVQAMLTRLDNYGGSSISSAVNYAFHDGPHRTREAAVHMLFENRWTDPGMRLEPGRWRQLLPIVLFAEDLPAEDNRVVFPRDWADPPELSHPRSSVYADAGIKRAIARLPDLLAPIGLERIDVIGPRPTVSHIQGTTVMGRDRASSVVDVDQVHHSVRNLVVVGTSVFPSCPTANPSLTAAALSLRVARRLAA